MGVKFIQPLLISVKSATVVWILHHHLEVCYLFEHFQRSLLSVIQFIVKSSSLRGCGCLMQVSKIFLIYIVGKAIINILFVCPIVTYQIKRRLLDFSFYFLIFQSSIVIRYLIPNFNIFNWKEGKKESPYLPSHAQHSWVGFG